MTASTSHQQLYQFQLTEADVEQKVRETLFQFSTPNLLEQYFMDIIVPCSSDSPSFRQCEAVKEMISYLKLIQTEAVDRIVRKLLSSAEIDDQSTPLLRDLFESLLEENVLPLKTLCDVILSSLTPQSPNLWLDAFRFISKHLHKLDYKGSRDLLKLIMPVVELLPQSVDANTLRSCEAAKEVILHICDRKNNLLPAYFVINEIKKLYSEHKFYPHWLFADLFTEILNSFRPLAQMVSVIGRPSYLPAANHCGLYCNVTWKLDPFALRIPLKGLLPFKQEYVVAQSRLMYGLMLQPNSRDIITHIMSISKEKIRCNVLEDILVSAIMHAMELAETDPHYAKYADRLWQHLSCQLIFFVLSQYTVFPKILELLNEKVGSPLSIEVCPTLEANIILKWRFILLLLPALLVLSKSWSIRVLCSRRVWCPGSGNPLTLSTVLARHLRELSMLPYRKGRDELMWMLLQFLSGGIQRSPVTEFQGIVDLYHLCYSGVENFTVVGTDASCVRVMAPTCIWLHITKRAQAQPNTNQTFVIPGCINTQMRFLQDRLNSTSVSTQDDYIISVLCNAYSTTTEIFQQRLLTNFIVDKISQSSSSTASGSGGGSSSSGSIQTMSLPLNLLAEKKEVPLSFEFLDSITIHVKMNIVHHIFSQLFKYSQPNKPSIYPSPAAMETYCRLLAYSEIDTLGTRPFFAKLLPAAINNGCQDLLYMLVEILLYRFRIPTPMFKLQALLGVNHAATLPALCSNAQLYWSMENLLVRGLMWLSGSELLQVYPRLMTGFLGGLESASAGLLLENEELAKLLVLAIAKIIRLLGPEISADVYRDHIARLLQLAPHCWSSVTLQHFPLVIVDLYAGQTSPFLPETRLLLKQQIEEEYLKWRTLGGEGALLDYFTSRQQSSSCVFLCVLQRVATEGMNIPPVAYRILEHIGPKGILEHIRSLCDYVVGELSSGSDTNRAQKTVDVLNDLMWKYSLFPMDRFLLTLLLRPYEGNDVSLSLILVHLLFQKAQAFTDRFNYLVQHMHPDFWMVDDWYERHFEYHKRFPEKFWIEKIYETSPQQQHQPTPSSLPIYYGSLCLRCLPILDLIVHRCCENPQITAKILDSLMDHVGMLYRFHPLPTSFLYHTFFYNEKKINDYPNMKRRLVLTIHRAFVNSARQEGWLITPDFITYCEQPQDGALTWLPDQDYYARVVGRLVECQKRPHQPGAFDFNWRFSEFLNPMSQALHSVCVELMALPVSNGHVGTALVDLILKSHSAVHRDDIMVWLNAIGLCLTALPISFSEPLFYRILEILRADYLKASQNIFAEIDFESNIHTMSDTEACRLLALLHAVCHHATTGYLLWVPGFLRKYIKADIRTEQQFVYFCHLVAPFMHRWHQEKVKFIMDVATDVYDILCNVDKNCAELKYEDTISDLLYHMKYMFVGDGIKQETDRIIPLLRPSLQAKLRYISHHGLSEVASVTPSTSTNII